MKTFDAETKSLQREAEWSFWDTMEEIAEGRGEREREREIAILSAASALRGTTLFVEASGKLG